MTNSLLPNDQTATTSLLEELIDHASFQLVASTIDTGKTVAQISIDNRLPLSSTYKKIKKLHQVGLLYIEKIELDGKGKKVMYYRSTIKSMGFNLCKDQVNLQFEKNDKMHMYPIPMQKG